MKVLVIGPSPSKSQGGMATVIRDLKEDYDLNLKFQIDIHDSYIDGNTLIRFLYSIFSFLKFLFIYKKYDVFHIHLASYGSTFRKGFYVRLLKKKKKKIILHVHGGEYLVFYNKLSEKNKKIVQKIWSCSDIVIALSKEWAIEFDKIFHHPQIIVINNGIDIEQYCQGRGNIEKFRKNFLFLGRLEKNKGIYDIIEAAKILKETYPDIKIYMAGDGEVEQLQKCISKYELDEQIVLAGWVDVVKKIELLKRSSTILLPSYNEGLPMCILEGMAAGKVIISTNVGAIPEVVKNKENGIIIGPGNVQALSDAMCFVIENVKFDNYASKNNINKIEENYSIKKMHKKIMHIYYMLEI